MSNNTIKTIVVVILILVSLPLIFWATQLYKVVEDNSDTMKTKFEGNEFLKHNETLEKWSAEWVSKSSVCSLGKWLGTIGCIYMLMFAILYGLFRSFNKYDVKKLNSLDKTFFWITFPIVVICIIMAFAMNPALGVRLIPLIIIMIFCLVIVYFWPNLDYDEE